MLLHVVLYAWQNLTKGSRPFFMWFFRYSFVFSMVLIVDRSWTDPDLIFTYCHSGSGIVQTSFLFLFWKKMCLVFNFLTLETWCLDSEKLTKVTNRYRMIMMIMNSWWWQRQWHADIDDNNKNDDNWDDHDFRPVEWCRDFEVVASAKHFLAAMLPPDHHYHKDYFDDADQDDYNVDNSDCYEAFRILLRVTTAIMTMTLIYLTWKTFIFGGDALLEVEIEIYILSFGFAFLF